VCGTFGRQTIGAILGLGYGLLPKLQATYLSVGVFVRLAMHLMLLLLLHADIPLSYSYY